MTTFSTKTNLCKIAAVAVFGAMAFVADAQEPSNQDLPVLYVSDSFEVPVRATGCSNCTIVHYGLASGTEVFDLGEEVDDWTRIRSRGGIEGWMPSRFLLNEPVAVTKLADAESELTVLSEQNLLLEQQIEDLLTELNSMGLSVETVEIESEDGEIARPVMSISGDVIGLNSQNEELIRRNQLMQQDVDLLTARNERLEDTARRTWFIYGACAVLAGALLSVLLPRLLPRKRYSEWG
jgi:SH3 domain protein